MQGAPSSLVISLAYRGFRTAAFCRLFMRSRCPLVAVCRLPCRICGRARQAFGAIRVITARLRRRRSRDTDISRWRRIRARYRWIPSILDLSEHLAPHRRPRPSTLTVRSRWRGICVHFQRNTHRKDNIGSHDVCSSIGLPGGRLRITFVESLLVPIGIDGSFVTNGVQAADFLRRQFPA